MKKILCLMFLSISFLSACTRVDAPSVNLTEKLITISEVDTHSTKDIANIIAPAIVGIEGISKTGDSVGSGVCVASGGYVLTNYHVIEDCSMIYLHLKDKTTVTAKVIYKDSVTDLAILKSSKPLPYLNMGDSDSLAVGEDILAVGTPLSLTLTHTFTKGIVSALNRTLKVSSTSGEGYMQNLIQHDASLNPGNSGGPLINLKGEVIGINTLKISSGEGIGFAIPTKSFKSLISSYAENINYKKPYLGVYGYDSEIANYYGKTPMQSGFYIIDIASNSPLNEIDIKNGSVITSLNGKKILNALDLKDALYSLKSTDVVNIEYYDGDKLIKTKTKLK